MCDKPVVEEITANDYEAMIFGMLPAIQAAGYSEVVAVMRGGMIAAQYISRLLRLPCGVYYPEDNLLIRRTKAGKVLFIEDNIGVGRTVEQVVEFMAREHPGVDWNFFPVFIDKDYVIRDSHVLDSFRPSNWLLVPGRVYKKISPQDFIKYWQYMKNRVRVYSRDGIDEV